MYDIYHKILLNELSILTKRSLMKWNEYMDMFNEILGSKLKDPPYDSDEYIEYVKLNWSRIKRWNKTGALLRETIDSFHSVRDTQNWILITEPWCADAANIAPMLNKIASLSPKIHFHIKLRDSSALIENYLTDGTRSIPILIVRNNAARDLYVWGPRPKGCKELVGEVKKSGGNSQEIKTAVQQWYNDDKGVSVQNELIALNEKLRNMIVEY